jgi:hypothetical protein
MGWVPEGGGTRPGWLKTLAPPCWRTAPDNGSLSLSTWPALIGRRKPI